MKIAVVFFIYLFGICSASVIDSQTKIVGGDYAKLNQFPHQVALIYRSALRCGGSIISSSYILTAAHCLVKDIENLEVLAGTNDLKKGGEKRKVTKAIRHENYGNFKNDVALLLIEKPFTFTSSINFIELQAEELHIGSNVTIIGWGKTSNWGIPSSLLKYNTVHVSSLHGCSGLEYGGILCFGHETNNGACNVSYSEISNSGKFPIFIFLIFLIFFVP